MKYSNSLNHFSERTTMKDNTVIGDLFSRLSTRFDQTNELVVTSFVYKKNTHKFYYCEECGVGVVTMEVIDEGGNIFMKLTNVTVDFCKKVHNKIFK